MVVLTSAFILIIVALCTGYGLGNMQTSSNYERILEEKNREIGRLVLEKGELSDEISNR